MQLDLKNRMLVKTMFMSNLVYIPILKKWSSTDCNYRTIALVPHASKMMLRILNSRLKPFLLPQLAGEQAGFMPRRGIWEQILNVRLLIEKSRKFNVPMYICFLDYTKSFESGKWSSLWCILHEMAVPLHLVDLIRHLYDINSAKIKTNSTV